MAADDVLQFEEWLESGKIKKLDAYVGEIFPGTYHFEYEKLKEIFQKYQCGRIAVFKNHSKIFAGIGQKFAFGIETSANINTNPRTENGCITIGSEIYEFYKSYFDGIESFNK
jgi:predicted amino acid racemase